MQLSNCTVLKKNVIDIILNNNKEYSLKNPSERNTRIALL